MVADVLWMLTDKQIVSAYTIQRSKLPRKLKKKYKKAL